jgi:hypothetical protein
VSIEFKRKRADSTRKPGKRPQLLHCVPMDRQTARDNNCTAAVLSKAGPHSHEREDEIFFVQEGRIAFLVDRTWQEVPEGLDRFRVFAPKMSVHWYAHSRTRMARRRACLQKGAGRPRGFLRAAPRNSPSQASRLEPQKASVSARCCRSPWSHRSR